MANLADYPLPTSSAESANMSGRDLRAFLSAHRSGTFNVGRDEGMCVGNGFTLTSDTVQVWLRSIYQGVLGLVGVAYRKWTMRSC